MNVIEPVRRAAIAALAVVVLPAWATETIPTEHFASLPDFSGVQLSPNGLRAAAIANIVHEGFTGKVVLQRHLETGEQRPVLSLRDGEYKINWIRWATEDKLLVSLRSREAILGTAFTSTRLMVVDIHTREAKNAINSGTLRRADWIPQFQDRVVDLMPDDDEHFLLQADLEYQNRPDVYRVNLNTGRTKRVQRGRSNVDDWLTDRQHRVRIGVYQDETTMRVYEQDIDGKNWRMLWEYQALAGQDVIPKGFAADPNILYVNAYHQGRLAIFRVDLSDPELSKELVYSNERLDVTGRLIYSPKHGDVVGIRTGIGDNYEFWSAEHRSLLRSVNQALPEHSNVIVSLSEDEQRIIFLSENDTEAGTYYYLDRSTMRMSPIASRYNALKPELMAEKNSIRYDARDGTSIQAFVTFPKGVEPQNLPAIVLPHGGPISFDSSGFDYWTQFFANRGYVVMQMNFRGSGGFGYDFMAAGFQSWGLEMQDDVADAASWLIDKGIADPERICIVGGSYGGYAALMGAAKTPELFSCAVSFAGVTDLFALLQTSRRYSNSDVTEIQIGDGRRNLRARSPVTLAEDIDIPVLLIHGDKDVRVRVTQSRRMAKALERAGKDFLYVEQSGGDHHLSTNEQRLEALKTMETFLAEHLN